MDSFKNYLIVHNNISYKINNIMAQEKVLLSPPPIDKNLLNKDFMFHLSNPNNKTIYLDKSEFTRSECIYTKNQLENTQKDIFLLQNKLILLEKEITQLKTQLYENNLILQKQKNEIYQLNKKLGEEQICHWLTKKLCILPSNLKN